MYRLQDSFIGPGYGFISGECRQGVDKNLTKVPTIRGLINLTKGKRCLLFSEILAGHLPGMSHY